MVAGAVPNDILSVGEVGRQRERILHAFAAGCIYACDLGW
jgi:hypothetical protein